MNKELILAFKDEFDYWLKDGRVLLGNTVDGKINWIEYVSPFEVLKGITIDSEKELIVIMNDEYVELRKALAEGKTIQLNEAEKFSDSKRGWVDLSCTSLGMARQLFPVNYYRIKEEPKYNIGDWVVLHFSHLEDKDDCPTQIRGIKDGVYYNDAECTSPIEEGTDWYIIGYWKPKAGDRCYFYNRGIKHLGTFMGMNGNFYLGNIQDYYEAGFLNCEPALSNVQFNKAVPRKKLDRIRRGDVCWYPSIGDGGVRVGRVFEVNDTHIIFNTGSVVKREYVYLFNGDIPLDIIEELNKEKFKGN